MRQLARPSTMFLVEEMLQDVRYGARMLLNKPVFTAVAVLSLALGIGANTAIFSLIDAVLLKLLPVKDPQQLVSLTDPSASGVQTGTSTGVRDLLSTREFEDLRARTQSFSGMFASESEFDRNNARIDGQSMEEVKTRLVSGDYFTVLGTNAAIGRTFTAADEQGPGSAPYAVISYEFWQRRFGASPSVLGSKIELAKASLSIIGVAQPGFLGENVGEAPDLWIPLDMQPQIIPGRNWLQDDPARVVEKVMWLHVIGRLNPGVSRQQAQANVNVVFKQIVAEEFSKAPESERRNLSNQSLRLHDAANGVSNTRGDFADPLYVLMAIVALVLLIACANVANLLLARATARQKEMSVRLAMGAKRSRIIRQFLIESLMLSVMGGIAGVLLAVWGVRLLIRMAENNPNSMILNVRPDLRVLLFTIAVCLLTGLIFGLVPAWRSANVNVSGTLKEAGRGLTGSGARIGLGKILVIVQIAMSVLLLIGAGWFIRTLRNLENVKLGYSRDKLVIVRVDPLSAGYTGERLAMVYRDLNSRLSRVPGVRGVTFSHNGLFDGSESGDDITVEGFKPQKRDDRSSRFDRVGPGYFSTLGIPILLGRDIGPQDTATSPAVCVVNETFAKFYFGSANPIGRHVRDDFPDTIKTFEIVGVARDARDHSLRHEILRRFYIPVFQPLGNYSPSMNFEIRTYGDPGGIMRSVRKTILDFDPTIPIDSLETLDVLLDDRLRQERLIAQLSTVFGGLALLLASVGLYGVLSYAIAQRTNEIGIRMALGAQRGAVTGMILRETGVLIVAGLLIGVPASLLCARFVESKLFGLKAADPLTLATALGILIAVAVTSGYLPARRAAKVDPLVALRYE